MRLVARELCLAIAPVGEQLVFAPCEGLEAEGELLEEGPRLKVGPPDSGLCVDAASETKDGPIAFHCHPSDDENRNQAFQVAAGQALVWDGPTQHRRRVCVDVQRETRPPLVFAGCAATELKAKDGQRFVKQGLRADGSFQLRDEANAHCLVSNGSALQLAPCTWAHAEWWTYNVGGGGQFRHNDTGLCLDANDLVTPLLYPCYAPGTNPKQHLEFRENGWLELPRSWGDNGRLRYPASCLDTEPVKPEGLVVVTCDRAAKMGATWERVWEETPLETRLRKEVGAQARQRTEKFLGSSRSG